MDVYEWIKLNMKTEDFRRILQSKRPRKKLISFLAPEYQNGDCDYGAIVNWIKNECVLVSK